MICSNIGCGRYVNGHARDHYEATGHFLSIQIDSERVWDYDRDTFVHRRVKTRDNIPLYDPFITQYGDEPPSFENCKTKKALIGELNPEIKEWMSWSEIFANELVKRQSLTSQHVIDQNSKLILD